MLAIVIPYFKINFFEETLSSLASQSDKRFKVYISNDESPENPIHLIDKYKSKLDLVYHKFETNLGGMSLVMQWDRSIDLIEDEKWIMILGDDDYLDKDVVKCFYEYYNSSCDESCLTVPIQENYEGEYSSSRSAHRIFQLLEYNQLNDIDVDKNPEIINQFDKIILLHNEYVTKREFDAIINHPNVIYLYPNSLYAQINVNYQENTITLIRGHGYPTPEIDNGFDWEFDNTRPYEFDKECLNWEFYEIDNGIMLNCYPDKILFTNLELLKKIKEY